MPKVNLMRAGPRGAIVRGREVPPGQHFEATEVERAVAEVCQGAEFTGLDEDRDSIGVCSAQVPRSEVRAVARYANRNIGRGQYVTPSARRVVTK